MRVIPNLLQPGRPANVLDAFIKNMSAGHRLSLIVRTTEPVCHQSASMGKEVHIRLLANPNEYEARTSLRKTECKGVCSAEAKVHVQRAPEKILHL